MNKNYRRLFLVSVLCFVTLLYCAADSSASSTQEQIEIGDASSLVYLPLIPKNYRSGFGSVSGTVGEIANDDVVSGASVCLNGNGSDCAGATYLRTTDPGGNYSFENLPTGPYRITVVHPEFIVHNSWIEVRYEQNTVRDINLIRKLEAGNVEVRIVLEWLDSEVWPGSDCSSTPGYDECPTFMDGYIWAQLTGGGLHYPYFDEVEQKVVLGDCKTAAGVCIETLDAADYTNVGPGPEIAAIVDRRDTNARYYYGVLNTAQTYTGVPAIKDTQAQITIYFLDGRVETRQVSSALPGTTGGDFWYVLEMDQVGNITWHNCITELPIDDDPTDAIIFPPECQSP